jgi:hypothetical protein
VKTSDAQVYSVKCTKEKQTNEIGRKFSLFFFTMFCVLSLSVFWAKIAGAVRSLLVVACGVLHIEAAGRFGFVVLHRYLSSGEMRSYPY